MWMDCGGREGRFQDESGTECLNNYFVETGFIMKISGGMDFKCFVYARIVLHILSHLPLLQGRVYFFLHGVRGYWLFLSLSVPSSSHVLPFSKLVFLLSPFPFPSLIDFVKLKFFVLFPFVLTAVKAAIEREKKLGCREGGGSRTGGDGSRVYVCAISIFTQSPIAHFCFYILGEVVKYWWNFLVLLRHSSLCRAVE